MDSNFQVKITADLGDLVAKIKNIEATLKKLDSNFKTVGAGSNLKNVGKEAGEAGLDMNRMRLASFALGQVLRDSGFFAQSFGLGLLAISNNIPILIDQLVMLSGISKGFGAAISLAGSVLTAILTVWAYSSMAVDKNSDALNRNKSVLEKIKLTGDEYYKTLSALDQARLKSSESSQKELTTLKLLYDEYKNSSSLEKRKLAYQQMQQEYPKYFGNLSFELSETGKVDAAYKSLTGSIIATATARAQADLITKNVTKKLELEDKIIKTEGERIKLLEKRSTLEKRVAEEVRTSTKEGAGIGAIVQLNSAIGKINDNLDTQKKFKEEIQIIDKDNLRLQEAYNASPTGTTLIDLEDSKIGVNKLKDAFIELSNTLKGISADPSNTFLESTKKKAEATATAIKKLVELGADPNSEKLKDLYKTYSELKLQSFEPKEDKTGRVPIESSMGTVSENLNKGNEDFLKRTKETTIKGIEFVNKFKASYVGLNEISKSAIRLVGGDLTNAFMTMANTGSFSFKTLGQAIGQMILKLVAAAAAALVLVALLSTIGLARWENFGKNFAQGFQTLGGVKFANGGIVSGPTSALIGEYPGARNNPEVVAPLDKLKSLIGDSGSGSGFTGQLETRISGNDLVILMNRANKNRNGYY